MNSGNEKISITAEFVSIIRSKDDQKNLYFVSKKGQKLYNLTKNILSEKKLKYIFEWRLNLSKIFDEKIISYKPEQVIELAAGYSLRGFNKCLGDKNIIYIDTDFENVLIKKRQILESLCIRENISFPNNYFLVPINVLENNIYEKISGIVSRDRKTLIIAEGLTSYFGLDEFKIFLKNIQEFIHNFSFGEFYSHENVKQPKGIVYFLLRKFFITFLTKSKSRNNFKNIEEFNLFLSEEKIDKFDISENKTFVMYSIFSK